MAYRYLGYGVTNSNGVAKLDHNANGNVINHSYVGTGAGELDIVASMDKPIASGSVVSQPHTVFDCPVYDGDNTPTSISWSKTNNAVVTDEVVSLIASVLNTNNNPCINIPVVFKQGNTVLGTAYTDCNGDATITYTWADSDIFNVTAQVGQSLSEDLTMFVKDKDNILPFNVWSCGDYSNNLTDFTINELPNTTITISKDYATNGEYGIKVIRNVTEQYYTQIKFIYTVNNGDYGKNCCFTLDINNQFNGTCGIYLDMGSSKSVSIPQGSNGSFSISSEIPNNISSFSFYLSFAGLRTGILYTDNWKLTIS